MKGDGQTNCHRRRRVYTKNLPNGTNQEGHMAMDYEQFYRGWLALIAQPWGQRYQDRSGLTDEQRATIRIQQELYFKRLSYCNPYLWEAVCEGFSAGDHWPSIDEIKQAIRANQPEEKKPDALLDPNWSLAPEPIALTKAYSQRESVSMRDAALVVLPEWIKANPEHSDAADARAFLQSAKGYFGMPRRKREVVLKA